MTSFAHGQKGEPMSDFISRQAAIDELFEMHINRPLEYDRFLIQVFKEMIEQLPSADVTEVIRCKNCQNWDIGQDAGELKIGDRISIILAKKRMSQKELAKAAKITEISMSRYINNERVPKATTIVSIAKALNVSADILLGLPSKQTEIIRCKDCKHYTFKPGPNSVNCYVQHCTRSVRVCTVPDDFCSRAEPVTEVIRCKDCQPTLENEI